jgi:hypothetical protein
MNSFGAYVASAATVSVPFVRMDDGTSAAIELTAFEGAAGDVDVAVPVPPPLLQAAATSPLAKKTTLVVTSLR